MKIHTLVYFGTAPIAVPALEALHACEGIEVVAVCTQPDRPSGRKRRLTPSPVKVKAEELGIEVMDPEKIVQAKERLQALAPDLAVVFAYGQYMPQSIFNLPTHGSVNFHPSLLPEYRGASPIQTAIADGRAASGLSVLQVSERMDAGDVLLQKDVVIGPGDTSETMTDRFAKLAAEVVPELVQGMRDETLRPVPQDESEATECGRLRKEDGQVDWTLSARELVNRVRAYQPWPGVFFPLGSAGNLKILEAEVVEGQGEPGILLDVSGKGPVVACGQNAVRLLRVQPPGKTPMSGRDFLNGHPFQPGSHLGTSDASG